MVRISKKEIEHIAELARLGITEKEKSEFSEQLSEVLSYVELLNQIDTKDVEPTAQVTGLKNVFRDDNPEAQTQHRASKKELLQNAPQIKDDYFKVPIVLDQQ
ncbi:MAG TPA: Asp-tRNA(Asn)/Glu-tRNA(Gln) amidotransferase subunit GatC [Patescibacteria group bacterium]|nr:Asp-tRNA(Asn)/Glu-tRNA(Gln) amidotransferase subunit GatC [Patescibacteria group bacterium]